MRPRSRRGFGAVRRVWALVVALLAIAGVLGLGTLSAGAESPVTVVVTEADLDWPEGALGSMTWTGFGAEVSEDPECVTEGIGGPITSIRFELTFDLSTDPITLVGTLAGAGEWRNPTDDPAYGQEWSSVAFSGPIVDGWARQTDEGWAWGGNADLTLDLAGARLCDIDLDEWQEEVYQFAYGSGQRQVTAAFSGGCFDGVNHGFGLNGNSRPDGDVGEPGEDVWYLGMGCTGCDFQLPPPIGSGCHAREPVSDSGSVFGVPPWLGPGVLGGPPAGDGGQSSAQPAQGEVVEEGRWDPLGVAILILLVALVIYGLLSQSGARPERGEVEAAVGAVGLTVALEPGLAGVSARPTAGETAVLARQITEAGPDGLEWPLVTPSRPVQPWSSPDEGAEPAGFALQPGQSYQEVGSTGAGPDDWVQVRHEGQEGRKGQVGRKAQMGWVRRSDLMPWRRQE